VASEFATAGSVIKSIERISPFIKGTNHFDLCSGVPHFAITSIFPVSGAEQLHASGAISILLTIFSGSIIGAFHSFGSTKVPTLSVEPRGDPSFTISGFGLTVISRGISAQKGSVSSGTLEY
jgi:hypothetical protein